MSQRLQMVADSPLFWIFLFASFALAAAVAIGPKYERRQARIERRFQARSTAAGRTPGVDPAPTAGGRSSADHRQSPSRKYIDRNSLIHRLWPIYLLLIALIEVSRARLLWRLDTIDLRREV